MAMVQGHLQPVAAATLAVVGTVEVLVIWVARF